MRVTIDLIVQVRVTVMVTINIIGGGGGQDGGFGISSRLIVVMTCSPLGKLLTLTWGQLHPAEPQEH